MRSVNSAEHEQVHVSWLLCAYNNKLYEYATANMYAFTRTCAYVSYITGAIYGMGVRFHSARYHCYSNIIILAYPWHLAGLYCFSLTRGIIRTFFLKQSSYNDILSLNMAHTTVIRAVYGNSCCYCRLSLKIDL